MLSYTALKAVCVGNDGMSHASEIDLNNYYGNRNANFVSGDKHFVYTAQNLSLHVPNSSITLKAELKDYDHNYQPRFRGSCNLHRQQEWPPDIREAVSTPKPWAEWQPVEAEANSS